MCAITVFHSLLPTWFSMLCHESLLMCCCLSPGAQKFIPVVPYMAQWVQNPTAVNAETQIQSLARELPYFMDVAMIKKKNSFLFPYNLHAPWRHWWSHMLWWPYLPSLSCHFYVPIILQNAIFQWVLLKTSVESIKKTMPPRAGSPEKTRLGITHV